LSRGNAISSPVVLEYEVPNSVFCSPDRLANSLVSKWISYRAAQAGSRQRFCVHLFLASPSLPICLQELSF
jgi:hypothetical protein